MKKLCIVLVDIRSTHNVGSIMRSADGFSAEVVLVGITPRPLGADNDDRLPHIAKKAHQAITKTALGAEESVRWRYFTDSKAAFVALKSEGYTLAAIEQDDTSQNIHDMHSDENYALIVGPEVEGLSKETIDGCDVVYEIPMSGKKESFNVSIAAGIALFAASS